MVHCFFQLLKSLRGYTSIFPDITSSEFVIKIYSLEVNCPAWPAHTPQMMGTVFSLTLARSPMASRSYRRASDFLNYSPGLASDILVEQKSEKKEEKNFF